MLPLQPISRRDALRHLSSGTLLALGLWPGALRAADQTAGRPFKFVVINDTHALSPECGAYLAKVVTDFNRHSPAFCLHVGDLTDNAERVYLETVRDTFAKLGAPTYFTPGNHDCVSETDRKQYDEVFAGQLNYTFDLDGWQIIALDTTEGRHYEKTSVPPATLAWLDQNLPRLDRRRPTIVFTHFPLGAGVKFQPLNADALLDRLREFNVQAVFNGHYHGFTEVLWHGAPITTNRCCSLKRDNHDGTKAKGYFLCTAKDGRLQRQFIEFKPKPA